MGLRTRLILLVLLPVVPALVLAFYTNREQRRFGAYRVEKDAMKVVQSVAAGQLSLIAATREHLAALARLPGARGTNFSSFDNFFASFKTSYTNYDDFGLIETNGLPIGSSFGHKGRTNLADRAHFQRVLETRDFAIGDYQAGDGIRKPSLLFGYPILDEKGRVVVRVVYAALDLAVLNSAAAQTKLPQDAVMVIFDRSGHILARFPEPEKWIGKMFPESNIMATLIAKMEGSVEMRGPDDVSRLYAFTSLRDGQNANLFVSVGIPTTVAYAEINQILIRNLIIVALLAVGVFIAARIYANSYILRPVKALANTAKLVAAGELNARTGIVRASDELNLLAKAFDLMAESLQRQRTQAEGSAIALRQSEERMRHILDTAIDAVVVIDVRGCVTHWNPQAETIFGWAMTEIAGKKLSETIIPPQHREAHERGLKHYLDTGVGPLLRRRIEITGLHRDGREFPVELSITPAVVQDEVYFSAFIRDITERKHAEEALKESLREKETLLKEIHHRVKNNLQLISSLLQLQSGYIKDPAALAMFREGQNRVRSMALIHEKLYQSRSLARIDMADYVRSLTSMVIHTYHTHTSRVSLHLEVASVSLNLDTAIPLGLMLNELISNCLGHAFPDQRAGVIRVALSRATDGLLTLTVEDNGVGLPEQLDWENTPSLGLRLIRILAEQLHGTVEIRRQPGTTVTLTARELKAKERTENHEK